MVCLTTVASSSLVEFAMFMFYNAESLYLANTSLRACVRLIRVVTIMAFINEIGNKYGELVVVRRAENDSKGAARWFCNCTCGKTRIARGTDLRAGNAKHCIKHGVMSDEKASMRGLYNQRRRESQTRKYEWKLTVKQFGTITSSSCYYCGKKPASIHKKRDKEYIYNGIDRVDNSKGYIVGNVVPCCCSCNRIKGRATLDIAVKMIEHSKVA